MDAEFWHARWRENQIGFHEPDGNAFLVRHLAALGLAPGARVFVPLSGKTRDIPWLLSRGHPVVAAELSRIAVEQLFEEMAVTPKVSDAGALTRFAADGLDVFVGDVFALDAATAGPIDAVYDRAALVALPREMREAYSAHVAALAGAAPQLMVAFDYAPGLIEGPPFSVDADEVARVHAEAYRLTQLERREVPGGLKGASPVFETVWRLDRRG